MGLHVPKDELCIYYCQLCCIYYCQLCCTIIAIFAALIIANYAAFLIADYTDLLLIALVIIYNYVIFKYALPFYRVAANDSNLKTKHVIRIKILKVEEEFVDYMRTRFIVYTDVAPPIISTQTVLIFKNVDYSNLAEGQMIEINCLDRDCKRILSINTYLNN